MGSRPIPTHAEGKNLFEADLGKVKRYSGTIPMLGPLVMADYGRADLRLKRLIKKVSAEAPWEAPKAEELDEQTFADLDPRRRTNPNRARGARHGVPGGLLG